MDWSVTFARHSHSLNSRPANEIRRSIQVQNDNFLRSPYRKCPIQFNRLNDRPTASDWTKRVWCCERERKWFSVRSFCVNKQTIIIYCVWTLTSSNKSTKHHDTRHAWQLVEFASCSLRQRTHTHSQCMLCKVHIRWWWWGDTAIRQKSSLNVEEEEEAEKKFNSFVLTFLEGRRHFRFVRRFIRDSLLRFCFVFYFIIAHIRVSGFSITNFHCEKFRVFRSNCVTAF